MQKINWELIERLHANVKRKNTRTKLQKLVDSWRNMSSCSDYSLEFYMIQYCLIANKKINLIFDQVNQIQTLDKKKCRKAYDVLIDLHWLKQFKNFNDYSYGY